MATPIIPQFMNDPREHPVIVRPRLVTERPEVDLHLDDDRLSCADAVDRCVEQWGVAAVLRAIRMVLWANGYNTWQRTIDDLAATEEEQ